MKLLCMIFGHKWLDTSWLSVQTAVVMNRLKQGAIPPCHSYQEWEAELFKDMPRYFCKRCKKEKK